MNETDELADRYAGLATVAMINTHSATQAAMLAERKQLSNAMHFGCSAVPPEYGVGSSVPHRVVIGPDGIVALNLDGLQGLGVLPSRMPTLIKNLAKQPPPSVAVATECAERASDRIDLVRRVQLESFADDVLVSEAMEREMAASWSEEAIRRFFESGGIDFPTKHS